MVSAVSTPKPTCPFGHIGEMAWNVNLSNKQTLKDVLVKMLKFVLAALVLSAVTSKGNIVLYQFSPLPNLAPGGQAPRIEAAFEDVSPGKVLLTVTASDLTPGEFLTDLYFNFDPADNIHQLHFIRPDQPLSRFFSGFSRSENSFDTDSSGCFDIHLKLGKPGREGYAGYPADGTTTYCIVGPGLNASDFAFQNSFGSCAGSYYALARVGNSCDSEWLGCSSQGTPQPVPEPTSAALLVLAAGIGSLLYVRKKCTVQPTVIPLNLPVTQAHAGVTRSTVPESKNRHSL